MARENQKTVFTAAEYARIEQLVALKEAATPSKQVGIRNKIRRIGLYWSDVADREPYTVENLRRLVSMGVIRIEG